MASVNKQDFLANRSERVLVRGLQSEKYSWNIYRVLTLIPPWGTSIENLQSEDRQKQTDVEVKPIGFPLHEEEVGGWGGIMYSAPRSRILAWESYGFLSFLFLPSFCVVTDISPHFPRIKNPFGIIHSILNLAGTWVHNKLNLLRWFWDLFSVMDNKDPL